MTVIASLRPYPKMKDSGVTWLGDVPEHWETPRLGSLLRERGETNEHGLVTEVLSVLRERGVILYSEKGNIGNKKSDDITRYKIVRPDDIVVNCMNVIIGSVGLSRYTGCLSPVYYVLTRRSQEDDPRYLNAYFQNKPFQLSLVRIGNGILSHRMRIPMELLKCEPFPRPPLPEQAAIVRFLEYADQRIRRYIRTKQKLIKLLEEQKQAIIHQAVTRGLDPKVPFKDSGVEWLGEIPAHWKVQKLKFLVIPIAGIQMGPFGASLTELESYDTGFKLFGQENTISGNFQKGNRWLTQQQFHSLQRYELRAGDLVLTRKGSIGKCRIVPVGAPVGIADSDTIRVRVSNERVSPQFIVMLLHYAPYVQFQMKSVQRGAILGGLNTATIAGLQITFPPRAEQDTLLEDIETQTGIVNRSITMIQKEIDFLLEYRTRLVADVVTGKLDVRETATRLPNDITEMDTLEELDATDEELGEETELEEDSSADA